jgi:hypothetical protein
VTVIFIYLLGVTTCRRSKGQKGVTLPRVEAEYVTISETVEGRDPLHLLLAKIHGNLSQVAHHGKN